MDSTKKVLELLIGKNQLNIIADLHTIQHHLHGQADIMLLTTVRCITPQKLPMLLHNLAAQLRHYQPIDNYGLCTANNILIPEK